MDGYSWIESERLFFDWIVRGSNTVYLTGSEFAHSSSTRERKPSLYESFIQILEPCLLSIDGKLLLYPVLVSIFSSAIIILRFA